MQAAPEISVIVPVYNVEEYIIECLDSIVTQDIDAPIEIIVVDDCGTDGSMRIVDGYKAKNSRENREIHIIHHERNGGLSAARNTGIRHSAGKYLYFMDSDDVLTSDKSLRLLHERMMKTDADLVFGEHCFWRDGKIEGKTDFYRKSGGTIKGSDEILYSYLVKWEMIACNKLIKKEFITGNSLYFPEGIYYEDNYWAFSLALKATHIEAIPEVTYNYRQRSGSITSVFSQKNYDSIVRCTEMHYRKIVGENLLEACDKNTIIRFYERFRQDMFWCAFRNLNGKGRQIKELFNTMKRYNIASLTDIWSNGKMTNRWKKRSSAFHLGRAGYLYLYLRYMKELKKLRRKQ
ncbi:MAG: glycosyltransferase [Bacteroidales bacterium]|nr:glycosyltransferase [Bacteroidales bacterium]